MFLPQGFVILDGSLKNWSSTRIMCHRGLYTGRLFASVTWHYLFWDSNALMNKVSGALRPDTTLQSLLKLFNLCCLSKMQQILNVMSLCTQYTLICVRDVWINSSQDNQAGRDSSLYSLIMKPRSWPKDHVNNSFYAQLTCACLCVFLLWLAGLWECMTTQGDVSNRQTRNSVYLLQHYSQSILSKGKYCIHM